MLPDGIGKLLQRLLVKVPPRLIGIRLDLLQRQHQRAALRRGLHRALAEQRAQTLAEPSLCGHIAASFQVRSSTSRASCS